MHVSCERKRNGEARQAGTFPCSPNSCQRGQSWRTHGDNMPHCLGGREAQLKLVSAESVGTKWPAVGRQTEMDPKDSDPDAQAAEVSREDATWAQQGLNLRPLPCENRSEGWQGVGSIGNPRFPLENDTIAMVGPSSFSPAFDKSLLHFCCTDSEKRSSPRGAAAFGHPSGAAPPNTGRRRFNRLGAAFGLPIATPALLSDTIRIAPADLFDFIDRSKGTL